MINLWMWDVMEMGFSSLSETFLKTTGQQQQWEKYTALLSYTVSNTSNFLYYVVISNETF